MLTVSQAWRVQVKNSVVIILKDAFPEPLQLCRRSLRLLCYRRLIGLIQAPLRRKFCFRKSCAGCVERSPILIHGGEPILF
jgi:hypothetical protein